MAYRSLFERNLVFIRWQTHELQDIDQLRRECAERRRVVRQPLIHFSIIPEESPPPNAEFRKRLTDRWAELMPDGERALAVIEGTSVRASMLRTMLKAMRLVINRRGVAGIYDSLQTALSQQGVLDGTLLSKLEDAQILPGAARRSA
jgi:hypothetical protein